MRSRENTILQECRDWVGTEFAGQTYADYYEYLTDAFGATAANDGIYTTAEIEHATKVLGRLIRLGGTE